MDSPRPNETPMINKKKRGRSSMSPKPEALFTPDLLLAASSIHTVGLGITGAAPPNSQVEVLRFAKVSKVLDEQIRAKLGSTTLDYASVDLDVSGLRYRPPAVEVSEAIEGASLKTEFAEMGAEEFIGTVEIPDYTTLVQRESEAKLRSIEHIKFVKKMINKVRKKNVNYLAKPTEEKELEVKPLSGDEVVLSVSLYPSHSTNRIQEYLVLSTQKLTELKDAFYCLQDESPLEIDAEPASIPSQSTKNQSGFFFIGDTFYNDTRTATNMNYSDAIVKFVESGTSSFWSAFYPLKQASMEESRFQDLTLQVGKKYLFCHRAKCEHIIVITDIREISPSDDTNANAYPKQIYQSKYRRRKCTICDRSVAKWITSEDTFSIEDPSYYCSECFDMAHKHHNGTINNTGFKILPYLHD